MVSPRNLIHNSEYLSANLSSFFFFFSFNPRSDQEENNDLRNYKIKSRNFKKKKEILVSLFSE